MSTITECHNILLRIANNKGYLLFDDILDAVADFNLSVTQVDALTEQLSSQGVVVYEEAPDLTIEHDLQDYSKVNYNAIYTEVIMLEPELEPIVNLIRDIPPPQYGETAALTKQLKFNSFARERLVLSNLRNVLRIALPICKQYKYSLSDAVSAGFIGLLTAADHYEIGGFSAFPSYSSLWIQQVIHRECSPDWMHYYYPYHIRQNMLKTIIAYEDYSGDLYVSTPDIEFFESLSNELELSTTQVKDILDSIFFQIFGCIDLDYKINSEEEFIKAIDYSFFPIGFLRERDGFFYAELIIDEEAEEDIYRHTIAAHLREQIDLVLDTLTPKEADILKYRNGLYDYKTRTLEEVGKIYGLSRERIRQIEAKALRKLRHPSRSKKLKDYY